MALTLLSIEEAAERYHISVEQLRAMVDDGRIVPVAVNGHVLLDDDEVRKVAGGNGNHVHWITLEDAARQYALEESLLERLAKDGIIRSGVLEDELHLAVEDLEPIAERLNGANFRGLEGQPIELTVASQRYDLPFRSLLNWAKRGHIRIIRSSRRPMLLNEADVAYARELARIRGITNGKALFPSSRQYSPPLPPWLSR